MPTGVIISASSVLLGGLLGGFFGQQTIRKIQNRNG